MWTGTQALKIAALAALAPLCATAGTAGAQQYPTKTIRMIVGYSAGGATDIAARVMAHKLSDTVGQQVIVDNRPGAASMLGSELVARSAPDGYTVLLANSTIAMPSLFAKLAFEPEKDLQPVSLVGYGTLVLTVHPSLPVKSVKDLVSLAQRRPGEMNYASAGSGSFTHLAMALFLNMTATDIVHIPYKSGGLTVIATMTGETQVTFSSIPASIPQVRQGRLRALAVSGSRRNNAFADVPTVSEAGVAGYEASSWYGILAPTATPRPVLTRLSELSVKVLATSDLKERLIKQGIEPADGGMDEFTRYFNAEVIKWAQVIKAAGIPRQ